MSPLYQKGYLPLHLLPRTCQPPLVRGQERLHKEQDQLFIDFKPNLLLRFGNTIYKITAYCLIAAPLSLGLPTPPPAAPGMSASPGNAAEDAYKKNKSCCLLILKPNLLLRFGNIFFKELPSVAPLLNG